MVERGNRTRANMIRSMLATMNMIFGHHLPTDITIDKFWCFAYQHACFTQRRLYNRMRDEIPYFLVHGIRPSVNELVIPGSVMTIIDPNKNLKPKLDLSRTTTGYFLAYSNNCKIRLYFDPKNPTKIKRSYHCIIDDVRTMAIMMKAIVTPKLTITPPISPSDNPISSYIIPDSMLQLSDDAFPNETIKSFTFDLPPFPEKIGLTIVDDSVYNLPFIKHCAPSSISYQHLPPGTRRNHFIVGINDKSPITAQFVINEIHEIQKSSDRQVTLDLVHRHHTDNTTSLAVTRAMFDQLPSLLHHRPVIASLDNIPESHAHFINAPSKPSKPRSIFEAMKTPYRHNWKAAAWNQFQKNHGITV